MIEIIESWYPLLDKLKANSMETYTKPGIKLHLINIQIWKQYELPIALFNICHAQNIFHILMPYNIIL